MSDVRDMIFQEIENKCFRAHLITEHDGYLSGVKEAYEQADEIGIQIKMYFEEGSKIMKGEVIGEIIGTPKKIAISEEKIIGTIAKFSGIATAASKAVEKSEGKIRIVSGSWKKMPHSMKDPVRKAILSGGASFRISNKPMVYFDKNYIKMLGSISAALESVKEDRSLVKVIQIKGKYNSIELETEEAIKCGCDILMVDTGVIEDLEICLNKVYELGVRKQIEIAFASGIKIEQIPELIKLDIDIICVGKEIVDATLPDIRLDVDCEINQKERLSQWG